MEKKWVGNLGRSQGSSSKTISHPAEASQREKKPILKQDVSEK